MHHWPVTLAGSRRVQVVQVSLATDRQRKQPAMRAVQEWSAKQGVSYS